MSFYSVSASFDPDLDVDTQGSQENDTFSLEEKLPEYFQHKATQHQWSLMKGRHPKSLPKDSELWYYSRISDQRRQRVKSGHPFWEVIQETSVASTSKKPTSPTHIKQSLQSPSGGDSVASVNSSLSRNSNCGMSVQKQLLSRALSIDFDTLSPKKKSDDDDDDVVLFPIGKLGSPNTTSGSPKTTANSANTKKLRKLQLFPPQFFQKRNEMKEAAAAATAGRGNSTTTTSSLPTATTTTPASLNDEEQHDLVDEDDLEFKIDFVKQSQIHYNMHCIIMNEYTGEVLYVNNANEFHVKPLQQIDSRQDRIQFKIIDIHNPMNSNTSLQWGDPFWLQVVDKDPVVPPPPPPTTTLPQVMQPATNTATTTNNGENGTTTGNSGLEGGNHIAGDGAANTSLTNGTANGTNGIATPPSINTSLSTAPPANPAPVSVPAQPQQSQMPSYYLNHMNNNSNPKQQASYVHGHVIISKIFSPLDIQTSLNHTHYRHDVEEQKLLEELQKGHDMMGTNQMNGGHGSNGNTAANTAAKEEKTKKMLKRAEEEGSMSEKKKKKEGSASDGNTGIDSVSSASYDGEEGSPERGITLTTSSADEFDLKNENDSNKPLPSASKGGNKDGKNALASDSTDITTSIADVHHATHPHHHVPYTHEIIGHLNLQRMVDVQRLDALPPGLALTNDRAARLLAKQAMHLGKWTVYPAKVKENHFDTKKKKTAVIGGHPLKANYLYSLAPIIIQQDQYCLSTAACKEFNSWPANSSHIIQTSKHIPKDLATQYERNYSKVGGVKSLATQFAAREASSNETHTTSTNPIVNKILQAHQKLSQQLAEKEEHATTVSSSSSPRDEASSNGSATTRDHVAKHPLVSTVSVNSLASSATKSSSIDTNHEKGSKTGVKSTDGHEHAAHPYDPNHKEAPPQPTQPQHENRDYCCLRKLANTTNTVSSSYTDRRSVWKICLFDEQFNEEEPMGVGMSSLNNAAQSKRNQAVKKVLEQAAKSLKVSKLHREGNLKPYADSLTDELIEGSEESEEEISHLSSSSTIISEESKAFHGNKNAVSSSVSVNTNITNISNLSMTSLGTTKSLPPLVSGEHFSKLIRERNFVLQEEINNTFLYRRRQDELNLEEYFNKQIQVSLKKKEISTVISTSKPSNSNNRSGLHSAASSISSSTSGSARYPNRSGFEEDNSLDSQNQSQHAASTTRSLSTLMNAGSGVVAPMQPPPLLTSVSSSSQWSFVTDTNSTTNPTSQHHHRHHSKKIPLSQDIQNAFHLTTTNTQHLLSAEKYHHDDAQPQSFGKRMLLNNPTSVGNFDRLSQGEQVLAYHKTMKHFSKQAEQSLAHQREMMLKAQLAHQQQQQQQAVTGITTATSSSLSSSSNGNLSLTIGGMMNSTSPLTNASSPRKRKSSTSGSGELRSGCISGSSGGMDSGLSLTTSTRQKNQSILSASVLSKIEKLQQQDHHVAQIVNKKDEMRRQQEQELSFLHSGVA